MQFLALFMKFVELIGKLCLPFILNTTLYILYRSDWRAGSRLWSCTSLQCRQSLNKPHYRYVQFTPPKPPVSLHGPDSFLLSDYLANSLIVDLDRRFGPLRPTNPSKSFLIVTFGCSDKCIKFLYPSNRVRTAPPVSVRVRNRVSVSFSFTILCFEISASS